VRAIYGMHLECCLGWKGSSFDWTRGENQAGHRRTHGQVCFFLCYAQRNRIECRCHRHNLSARLDPDNEGVLIVNLSGQGGGMSADEMTKRLEKDDQSCVIM